LPRSERYNHTSYRLRSSILTLLQGQPAAVRVYNVPDFSSPVSQKTFFKGDKVQLKWNDQGKGLIVLAQTEVDKTNKSYYGETNMYILSADGEFDARITLGKHTWWPSLWVL
jgi:translation initiation factor 2A